MAYIMAYKFGPPRPQSPLSSTRSIQHNDLMPLASSPLIAFLLCYQDANKFFLFLKIMFNSCLDKQRKMVDVFAICETAEEKYLKLIELGRNLPSLPASQKQPLNMVSGCQSILYLHTSMQTGKLIFCAESEALISAGLAALLIHVYSEESPETVLTCPPEYLEALGIRTNLTPTRANGLYSIHLRMKQEALKALSSKVEKPQ